VRKLFIIFIFLQVIFTSYCNAQSNELFTAQSRLLIQWEDGKGKLMEAYTESSNMTLSLSTGEFVLKADLSTLKTANLSLDSLIKSKGSQQLIYKGKLSADNLYIFTQHVNDEKDYFIEGQLSINSKSTPGVAIYNPTNFSEKSDNKKFRMNFELIVSPSKITILGLENFINKQLIFKIINGPLNTQP